MEGCAVKNRQRYTLTARISALLLCISVTGEVAAERTVASMGEFRATVSDQNWCGPIIQVEVKAPPGSSLNANSRELQLLTGGVRQILTLECPGVQELQLTGRLGDQFAGRWRNQSDGQLTAMAPPTSSGNALTQASSAWTSGPATTAQVAQVQSLLSELGYHPGPVDGLMGQRTRVAIVAFLHDRQLPSRDFVNSDLLEQLHLARCGSSASCDPRAIGRASAQVPEFQVSNTQTATGMVTPAASSNLSSSPTALLAPALAGATPVDAGAQASVDVEASGSGAGAAEKGASSMLLSHDYQAMAARFGLRTLKGVPVLTGSSGVLTEEQAKAAIRLLDFVALGATPEHVKNHPECWARNYLREAEHEVLLADGAASSWLTGIDAWHGSNEFERARTREAFIGQYSERLRGQAVAFPLEFIIVQKMRLQGYDHDAGGFSLSAIKSSINGLGDIDRMLGASHRRPACAVNMLAVSPPAAAVPEVWRMPPERAEQVLQRLNERNFHVAIGVRLREMPIAEQDDQRPGYQQIPVWAEVTSIAAYEDPDLERLIEDFGFSTATAPVMLTGLPEEPSLPERMMLDQESLALVMLRDHGDVLSDTAWQLMLKRQAKADENYYSQLFLRDTGSPDHDFNPRYTPFFPKGYRYRHGDDLSDKQISLFKAWTDLRASNLPKTLNLRVGIASQRNQPTGVSLPVMQERYETARLVEWLGEQGYSTHQVLLPDADPWGGAEEFDPAIMAGPGAQRKPFLVLPNLVSRYVPELSQEEAERILGGASGQHFLELALKIGDAELVVLDDRVEALVVKSEPVQLFSHDRTGREIVYAHDYEVPALLSELQEVVSPSVMTAPEGPLPLSAEVMDLLMVRYMADAVSDEDFQMMLEARWAYEDSMPVDGAEVVWGRFFVPGRLRPDETQFAQRLPDFKAWTLERAAALPDTFTLYQNHVILKEETPIDILGSRTLRFGPMELMFPPMEVRSCHLAAQNLEALTQACDFLDSVQKDTPSIHPLGLGYHMTGPRMSCGMAMRGGRYGVRETAYCKARRDQFEQVGSNAVEPGFRDILVLNKEVVFDGSPAQADAASGAGARIEFAVREARVTSKPLPVDFVEAERRIMAYQQALGWDEHRWFKSNNSVVREMLGLQASLPAQRGVDEVVPPKRYFVFEADVLSAELVNKRSGERVGELALLDPATIDLAALEIPDVEALTSLPDAPYGQDVVGIQIGMGFDEAETIIRAHMSVGQILVRDRKLNPGYASGEFDPFSSSRVFVAQDMSELIVLYDEPPAAEGIVMGVTRQLAFPRGQVTIGLLLRELRKKYGEEDWSDRNRLKVGWGRGFSNARPSDLSSHPCFPAMRQMPSSGLGQWHWVLEDGGPVPPMESPSGGVLRIPGMIMSGMNDLEGRECGVSLVLDSSTSGDQDDLFMFHLTDPNRYLRLHARSQEIVKSGESSTDGKVTNLEIKL